MSGDWRDKLRENATVLSCNEGTGKCDHCGQRRLVFQAHFFKAGKVVAGCKECLTDAAGGPELIVVRHIREEVALPRTWENDARNPDRKAPARPKAGLPG